MTIAELEEVARRARESFSRMEHEAVTARENGTRMSLVFWHAFSDAHMSVTMAERAVILAKEERRKSTNGL